MYKDNFDFTKISKALDSVYDHLQSEGNSERAIDILKEAEENLQQAINYNLSAPTIRKHT
jgi:uncharacterized protein YpuA (DUF1002 family)